MSVVLKPSYMSATCTLVVWGDGSASLSDVYSSERRQGHATKLLDQVLWFVDRHGMKLVTAAEAYDEDGMTTPQLVEFYKKFDFVVTGEDPNYVFMERLPL